MTKDKKSAIPKQKESDWVGHIVFQRLTLTSRDSDDPELQRR